MKCVKEKQHPIEEVKGRKGNKQAQGEAIGGLTTEVSRRESAADLT